ncbi:MAG: energy transducer TonB [Acidobacteria bacterium]|nr:energy transducer TonB [Acidobacteriota bacterium]
MRVSAAVTTFFVLVFVLTAKAEKVATITVGDAVAAEYAARLRPKLSANFTLLDEDLASSAFRSFNFATPTNLTVEEASAAGKAMGCDLFIVVSGGTNRRTSFEKPEYYESYASIYVVETRTGRLLTWLHPMVERESGPESLSTLLLTVDDSASEIEASLQNKSRQDDGFDSSKIEALPDTPEKGLKPPIPYRRIKPAYTEAAERLGIAATVEILVDINADGKVLGTNITRWAGFGLDEAVDDAVRKMSWRPAYRDGKPVAMRVLLRYNFKRLDKPQN